MTYPPQPPGPPGQGPGPYNQGPYNQDPYNQGPPPWAAGPQGGFPVGPPPKKRRAGLIVSLTIVAGLVIGGGAIGAYLLLGKDDKDGGGPGDDGGDDARAVAETYVRELETALSSELADVDLAPLKPVACSGDFTELEGELADARDSAESRTGAPDAHKVRVRMKDYRSTSDGGTFAMTIAEVGEDDEDAMDMTVADEDGDLKVCGLYDGDSETDGAPGGETQEEEGSSPSREIPPNPIPTTP